MCTAKVLLHQLGQTLSLITYRTHRYAEIFFMKNQLLSSLLLVGLKRSHMDRFIISSHARFLECFTQSRMSVACSCYISSTCAVLHRQYSCCKHFSCIWADYMHTKNLAIILICKNFNKSITFMVCSSTAISHEGEEAFFVLNTSSL